MPGENVIGSMVVQISAQNTASAELTRVGKDMNTAAIAGRSMGEKIGDASSSFAKMGYTVNSAMMMLDRFEVSQLSLDSANVQVDQSQRRYNEAVQKYGEISSQAQTAAASLAVAQNSMDSANIRANSSMILIGLSALAMVPQFFTAGKAIVLFATTGKLAIAGLTLTISTMAPYLIVIGAALGLLYYWYTKNAEASYALRSEQNAYATSTEEAALAGGSLLETLKTVTDAQDAYSEALRKATEDGVIDEREKLELAVLNERLTKNTKELAKAILDSGMSYEEAQKFAAAYGLTLDDLGLTVDDFNKKMKEPIPAPPLTEVNDWKDALGGLFMWIVNGLDMIIQETYEFGGYMISHFFETFGKLWEITVAVWNAIAGAIMGTLQALWNWLFGASIIPDIVDGFTEAWENIKNFTITAWESIKNAIITPIMNTWNWLVSIWNEITTYLSETWGGIKATASTTWESIKNAISNPITDTWNWLVSTWDSITTALGNVWDDIKILASTKWAAIKDAIWDALPEWLQEMIDGTYTWTWPALPDWSAAWDSTLDTIYEKLPSWFKELLGLEDAPTPTTGGGDGDGDGDGGKPAGRSVMIANMGNGKYDFSVDGEREGMNVGYDDMVNYLRGRGVTYDALTQALASSGSTISFAEGGIVTKPTRALVGEAGPEAIIPLPGYLKGGGGGMGAINVTLNIGNVYGIDDLDAAIRSAFENLQWRIRAAGG